MSVRHRVGTALLAFLALAAAEPGIAAGQAAWQPSPGHVQIPIWPGVVPDARPVVGHEISATVVDPNGARKLVGGKPWVYVDSVSQPTMTVYSPVGANTGTAVVVFPGGGYNVLANHGEIHDITPASFRFLWHFRHLATADTGVKRRLSREFFKGVHWKRSWRNDQASPFESVRTWDPSVDEENLRTGHAAATAALPMFEGAKMAHQWAGVIDVTPDALPVISPIAAIAGLFLSSGYSGHGFGIGPAAGRLTADMVLGRAQAEELKPYRFERFADGSIRPGPAVR